ncbi:MAG: EAL domain-containing protein, partial [Armatimonadaceae bacterium]
FAYLANMRLDRLKIDRSLIRNVDQSEQDAAVIRAVVDLAHTLGMEVVAEGVETRTQYERLISLGCDMIQGFYFSKPLPVADLPKQLTERRDS